MSDAWDERKKALEEEYFRRQEREAIAGLQRQQQATEKKVCPDCGCDLSEERLQDARVNRCATCGGVWVSADDLQRLLESDRRSGLARWFRRHGKNSSKREV